MDTTKNATHQQSGMTREATIACLNNLHNRLVECGDQMDAVVVDNAMQMLDAPGLVKLPKQLSGGYHYCANCNNLVYIMERYCAMCGYPLKWEKDADKTNN